MSTPDELEQDVARTRQSLSQDVVRLNDRVSPSAMVSKRTDKIKRGAASIKDRLMGSSDSAGQAAGAKLNSAASSVKDATDNAGAKLSDAAGSAPDALREQTSGNPIAAGLIAFGVGWLLSSLAPASQLEQDAAQKIEGHADAVLDPLKKSAQEVAANLQQPVQDSADAMKQTTSDAAAQTTDHAKAAVGDVQDHAQSAAGDVQGSVQSAAENAKR